MRSAMSIRVTNRNWRTLAAFDDTRTDEQVKAEQEAYERAQRQYEERLEREAQFRALALPLITFPYGEAVDVQNGIARICVAVDGVNEWVPIIGQGHDERMKELVAMWRHYEREWNRVVNQKETNA